MSEPSEQKTPSSEEPVTLPYAPAVKQPKVGNLFISCLWGAAIVVVLVSIVLPSRTSQPPVPRTRCAARLRSIGQALSVYADEWNGQLPRSLPVLIGLGLCADLELVSPMSGHTRPACDYYYVTGLTWDDPPNWIVAYADPAYDKGRGANVLYLDDHVTYLREPGFSQELQRFKAAYEQARGRPPTIIPPK